MLIQRAITFPNWGKGFFKDMATAMANNLFIPNDLERSIPKVVAHRGQSEKFHFPGAEQTIASYTTTI